MRTITATLSFPFACLMMLLPQLASAAPLDLSGGSGGTSGNPVYTAPNGTIVRSSQPVYKNKGYYDMRYMFNSSMGNGLKEYFLAGDGPEVALTFEFDQIYTVEGVQIFPTGVTTDAQTRGADSFQVFVSADNKTYVPASALIKSDGWDHTKSQTVPLDLTTRYLRITFNQGDNKCASAGRVSPGGSRSGSRPRGEGG